MKIIGAIGQWFGMLVVVFGIVFEFMTEAPIGYQAISIGAFLYAVSTKMVHHKNRVKGENIDKKSIKYPEK